MKTIVVASDTFKGSVSSMEVADAAEIAILRLFKDCKIVKKLWQMAAKAP